MGVLTVKIRPMQKTDIDDVISLEQRVFGNHHWSKDSFINELSNDLAKYFSVLNEDGKLIAYCGMWQILEEAHITNISVSPDYRRMHIGEVLLTKLIEECYKNLVKYMTLEVRVGNHAAIGLYEKYGFKSLGIRKGYYQDNNEDALIMWTENIFYSKFKTEFDKNIADLREKINIL